MFFSSVFVSSASSFIIFIPKLLLKSSRSSLVPQLSLFCPSFSSGGLYYLSSYFEPFNPFLLIFIIFPSFILLAHHSAITESAACWPFQSTTGPSWSRMTWQILTEQSRHQLLARSGLSMPINRGFKKGHSSANKFGCTDGSHTVKLTDCLYNRPMSIWECR